nr:putative disease resistance protein rga4 [Quercus suber]
MPLEIRHHTYLETILPGVVVRKEGSGAKSNGGPSQLKKLHNLGGKLIIENLGYGKDDVWECKEANLRDKQHLQHLVLKWDHSEWDAESDEMLEALQPHPNLKALELRYYMGVRIPSWLSSLTNLVRFKLEDNKRLQHLPPLNQLPFLKEVYLEDMEALEYIEYIWIDEESVSNVLGASSSSSSSKTPFFPSLSSLWIAGCPKLKGWWRNSDDDNEPHHLLLPSFPPSLSTLHFRYCPNLTSMPPFPYLKEELSLWGRSWKVLEQTMKMEAATTSTYFPPLSQLRELNLSQMIDFASLPEDWLRNLVSLRKLSIQLCNGLVSLPWIGSLTSLQILIIWQCPNLTSLPQEISNLTSLKELEIWHCPLLGQRCKRQIGENWPFIAHVPIVRVDGQNQQEETISSESELVSLLPEDELILQQALQDLDYFTGCPNLTSLPQEIRNLTS